MKQIIAYYLPQYHPTKRNNEWWGKGFTEWTNVGKAKKLYPGHYQPKVPSELGYYDLRLPEVREAQVELAKEAGVTGFCYYHYWFEAGFEELERPFNEVVESGKPDFPFCVCWANESWYSKFWNNDGTVEKKILAEQKYLGKEDNEKHFYSLLKAFKDKRYIRVDGKLLFVIYQPLGFKNFKEFKAQWNQLAIENGLEGFFFVGQTLHKEKIDEIIEYGFDAVNHCHRLDNYYQYNKASNFVMRCFNFARKFIKVPFIIPYKKAIKHSVFEEDYREDVFPTMMPNWDHTPRSGRGGTVLHNATPKLFEEHAQKVLATIKNKKEDKRIVFLKSWNEWGEGNYMEPDLKFGRGFINALKKAIEFYNSTEK